MAGRANAALLPPEGPRRVKAVVFALLQEGPYQAQTVENIASRGRTTPRAVRMSSRRSRGIDLNISAPGLIYEGALANAGTTP